MIKYQVIVRFLKKSIVIEPEFNSPEEAKVFCEKYVKEEKRKIINIEIWKDTEHTNSKQIYSSLKTTFYWQYYP